MRRVVAGAVVHRTAPQHTATGVNEPGHVDVNGVRSTCFSYATFIVLYSDILLILDICCEIQRENYY